MFLLFAVVQAWHAIIDVVTDWLSQVKRSLIVLIQHGVVYTEIEEKDVKASEEFKEVITITHYSVDTRYIEARTRFAKEVVLAAEQFGEDGRYIVRELAEKGKLNTKQLLEGARDRQLEERAKQQAQAGAEPAADLEAVKEVVTAGVDKVG